MDREDLKSILVQYTDLQQEIRDLQERINRKQRLINQMEQQGYTVKDTVRGSRIDGTIGPIAVEGFPYPDYSRQKSLLRQSITRMEIKQNELLELTNEIEKLIEEIPISKTRNIFRYRYLDNMSWVQVAIRIGGGITDEGCRSIHNRYLGIKK